MDIDKMKSHLPGRGSFRGLDTGTVGEEGGVVGVDGVWVWKSIKKNQLKKSYKQGHFHNISIFLKLKNKITILKHIHRGHTERKKYM